VLRTILIVDDDAVFRQLVRVLLSEIDGLRVVGEAEDGDAAVALADLLNPDALVIDVSMPRMSGIDAAREIKRARPSIRIVFLTGTVQEATIARARSAALGPVVVKTAADLQAELAGALGVD
jgi:DNA-binding NarL/FixJ family response regulator